MAKLSLTCAVTAGLAPGALPLWLFRRLFRHLANVLAVFTATVLLPVAHECHAQSETLAAEYQVKAAFLYKFAGYVEWPPQSVAHPDSPLVIGVLGADLMADALEREVGHRVINGHPISVRKLRRGESYNGMQILFIGRAEDARATEALAPAKGQPILAVTESEEAFNVGSAINFVVVDDRVRFDVATRPAEHSNLKISSRLLTVARKVVGGA
jgi:hypothetical protein